MGRVLERFPDIATHLQAMVEWFITMLDCVDVGFVSNNMLEELPAPSWGHRVGGIDLNKAACAPSWPR